MKNTSKQVSFIGYVLIALFLTACNLHHSEAETSEAKTSEALYDYDVEERIKELGIELTVPGKPVANYLSAVRTGDLVFMAGKGPLQPDKTFLKGKLGQDLNLEQGYLAASYTAVEQLSALKAEIGDLNKVVQIVKVTGMVNAVPEFTQHSQVINGFSDLMVDVFGDRGKHARAAVGMSSLPLGFACEVEMVVQVRD